jgi:uncharacterized membrane protein YhhN
MIKIVRPLDAAAWGAALLTLVLVAFPGAAASLPFLKPLPALLWAFTLVAARAPGWPLMTAALILSAVGDFLLAEGSFLTGAASFAVVQVLYALRFWGTALRNRTLGSSAWGATAAYAGYAALLLIFAWPRVGDLAPVMAVYAVLLVVMAGGAAASGRGWLLTLGAGLFFLSDSLILAFRAWPLGTPLCEWAILVPYFVAQGLIALDQRRPAVSGA